MHLAVQQFLQAAAGEIRYQAVFMMGLPGSGKGYIKARKYLRHQGFVDIDPDEIKQQHPGYDPSAFGTATQNAIHEWSFDEAGNRLAQAMAIGAPFILDGTGTDPDKVIEKMLAAKAKGYRTFLAYVKVPMEVAIYRNRLRGAMPGGRWVPEPVIIKKVNRQDAAFSRVRAVADKATVFLNYTTQEEQAAKIDVQLYPPPQKVLPPRPGDPGYGTRVAFRRMATPEEYSFIMFKPLAVQTHRQAGYKRALEGLGATFEQCEMHRVTEGLITKHYQEHGHKPFFPALVGYYTGKVVEACRVSGGRGLILKIRRKLGPSDPTMCLPGEHLRAEAQPYAATGATCGIDNFIHASDSPASAHRELVLWGLFPGRVGRLSPPRIVQGSIIASQSDQHIWNAWVAYTGEEAKAILGHAAQQVAQLMVGHLRRIAPEVTGFEVQQAPRGKARTIWFLPDEASILPIYIRAGDTRIWTAKAGGSAGILLGTDPVGAAKALVRECLAQSRQSWTKAAAVEGEVQNAWEAIVKASHEGGLTVGKILDRHLKPLGYQCNASSKLAYRDGKLFIFFTLPVSGVFDIYAEKTDTPADPDGPEFQKALRAGLSAVQAYLGVAPYLDSTDRNLWRANVEVTPPGRYIKGTGMQRNTVENLAIRFLLAADADSTAGDMLEAALLPVSKDLEDTVEALRRATDKALKGVLSPLLGQLTPVKFGETQHAHNGQEYDNGDSYWYTIAYPGRALLQGQTDLDLDHLWAQVAKDPGVTQSLRPGAHLPALQSPLRKAFAEMVTDRSAVADELSRFEIGDLVPEALEGVILGRMDRMNLYEEDISFTDAEGEAYGEAASPDVQWAIKYAGDVAVKATEQGAKLRLVLGLPVKIRARKILVPGD